MKKKIIAVLILAAILCPILMACNKGGGDGGKTLFNNETDPLVLSSSELDEVFNPFFATSGADMEVVGLTQMSMMTTNKNGEVTCGDNEATVAKAFKENVVDTRPDTNNKEDYDNYYTSFEFLIKNGLSFSDGTALTIKDILFNLYVYLDPVYTGSSTIYSTDIKGLKAYRAQTFDENEYKDAEAKFESDAQDRLGRIISWAGNELEGEDAINAVKEDLNIVKESFLEELYTDWSYAASLVMEYNKDYAEITETWQVFLVLHGYIELETERGKPKVVKDWLGMEGYASGLSDDEAKEKCVQFIFRDMITLAENAPIDDGFRFNILKLVAFNMYKTQQIVLDKLIADEKEKHFEEIRNSENGLTVKNISGITVNRVTSFYGESLNEPHYVLKININGVDPKAKYNFSFGVAPMRYYSTTELYQAAMNDLETNYENPAEDHFGVIFSSTSFMLGTVRDRQKVPIGAGPYQVTNKNNDTGSSVSKNAFYENGVVYYTRNNNFPWPAKIKLLRFKVISSAQLYRAVENGEVHFAEPNAQMSTINNVRNTSHLDFMTIDMLGYGYVGINAGKITDINVRKAIMYALDTAMTVTDYYTSELASPIYRPMSTQSWAYPTGATAAYPFDETGMRSLNLLKDTYVKDYDGILWNGSDPKSKLKFTFTIAGDSNDHPIYNVFNKAKRILDGIGFSITIMQDSNALKKLAEGSLTVWAAAWGSTIDPDMYQVYHMDSTATSVLNWGYKEIFNDNYRIVEQNLVKALSAKIEEGRKYLDPNDRAPIYHQALDLVMELAIELPTYQRKNLYVYNKNVIDVNTMNQECSAFYGPLAKIWELSLVTA